MPSMLALRHFEMQIEGDFYSGSTSRRQQARLSLAEGQLALKTETDAWLLDWESVTVMPRVGNTPRYIHLPDDGVFETTDNDGVDQLARQFKRGTGARMLHRLENNLGLILVAVVVAGLTIAGTFVYGVPFASRVIAEWMPQSIVEQLGQATLDTLDSGWMEPSELGSDRQAELKAHFETYLASVSPVPVDINFRSSPAIGANAMALPNGTIIFTDDMVNLAQSDDELKAVLAHELGHVVHNHGMKGVVHSSLTLWLIVIMTGDLSSFADSTVAGPAVLMNLAYSRDMEREADQFALTSMQQQGIDPANFSRIMRRMSASHEHDDEVDDRASQEDEDSSDDSWLSDLGALVSSHPMTEERLRMFDEAAAQ
ncbi:M48 family metallopeptidase [Marinobacter sp. BGYM27]|uniref:M48 family metallopeptidase n=1 Tax=Marinobacter sp. BGYM27 TaxID=2975597 RepID=UPI0021A516AF|nr:M48 family metallopeptidase [Marinobacter sp. BGYM27]MDG5498450.1 M48 family metallopeptidase [Marinobacter sp. BGYM27]